MPDREKVIANLTRCQECLCDECDLEHASHYVWDCEAYDQLINDALELLKGQEPIKPVTVPLAGFAYTIKKCGGCGTWLRTNEKFCPSCGKAVE